MLTDRAAGYCRLRFHRRAMAYPALSSGVLASLAGGDGGRRDSLIFTPP